ncbi:MAG: hypothetical protein ACRDV1_11455 [Actinomycetes bacterium]
MNIRPTRRLAITGGLVAILGVAVAVQPAAAHAPSASGIIYNTTASGGVCTIGASTIGYDHTAENSFATARTTARAGGGGCNVIRLFPPGHLAVRLDVQKWKSPNWVTCVSTTYVYNTTLTDTVSMNRYFGPRYPNCTGTINDGPGYFRTKTVSYAWDGSAWRGGAKYSPYHLMPVA